VPLADKGTPVQGVSEVEAGAEDPLGGGEEGDREVEEPVEDPDLLADERCSQAVLDFLSTTDVGRLVPPEEEGDTGSEGSEWELRERREREEERRAVAEVLGAGEELGGGDQPLFLPTPSFMASAEEE